MVTAPIFVLIRSLATATLIPLSSTINNVHLSPQKTKIMNYQVSTPLVRMMRMEIVLFALFCLFMTIPVCTAGQASNSYRINGKTFRIDAIDKEVNKILSDVSVPALSIAVIDHDQVVFSKNYGYKSLKDMEKVDNETIFEAASLSKSFLLLVVYKLVDEGKLDLDKPLYQYLKHDRLEHDPRYKLITGRMILSHSSGIENWQANHNSDTLEILSDPGKEYVYSGEGYNYLAEVIEVLLGETIERYMQNIVFNPLMLKRTYSNFNEDGTFPVNYAYGHDEFGTVKDKWKNKEPVPSSGIGTTAGDYAKLIVALFNGKYLSDKRVKEILTPVIRTSDDDPNSFYGPGFELLVTATDTMLFQGGSNDGYKGHFCYSVKDKRGVVILTNGDRGKRLVQKIAETTAGMDVSAYFSSDVFLQYPSIPCELFSIYRKENSSAMFSRMTEIINERGATINKEALNELGYTFRGKDSEIAKRFLQENIKLFPQEPNAYWILGKIYYGKEKYQLAHENLVKAKNLNFHNQHWIEYDIKKLEQIMSEMAK
jgi:CubicO group peptidase (beta-lactamase class C family)